MMKSISQLLLFSVLFCSVLSRAEQTTVENPVNAIEDAQIAELTKPEVPTASAVVQPAPSAPRESEIPVQLEPTKKAATDSSIAMRAVGGLIVLAILGIGAYFAIGRYRRTQIGKTSAPEIKVLRQHFLGPKKSLAIIRVAGESILIGVTDSNINLIKSLSLLDEDIPTAEEVPASFASAFEKSVEEPQDEYAISGIRDFVSSRLKNMRSLN